MSIKFSSFDSMTKQNKLAALTHAKQAKTKRKDDFHLALHALLDPEPDVRLTAKLVYGNFTGESYFVDLKGLAYDQVKRKIAETFQDIQGIQPQRIEYDGGIPVPQLSKELQARTRKAELHHEWDGPFPRTAAILNTLREDTQSLIQKILLNHETIDRVFLGFYHAPLKPFRELTRSLDSTTAEAQVNLQHVVEELKETVILNDFLALLDRPIYLLLLVSNQRLILFLRDHMKLSEAAILPIPFQHIKQVTSSKSPTGISLEIETHHDLLKIPRLFESDGLELEKFLREKSIESIQADADFIDRDFDRELARLEMLYKTKSFSTEEYIFRKNRLKKMELEKFSDGNIELMLAKRFSDAEFGKKVDDQILKRFTHEKTIMFTDIVGYSEKAAEKELIDTMTLLAVHDRTLLPTIAKHHGTLIKKIGDALMVKFDTPRSACIAAREMQNALIEFNRSSSEKILIRIGINTGTVFVKGEDIFGDAVNVASRMEAMAQPGKIYMTDTRFHQLDGEFPCQDCGERRVKGQKQPLRVFALIDETGADEEMIANARELGAPFGEPETKPEARPPIEAGHPRSPEPPVSHQSGITQEQSVLSMKEAIDSAVMHYKSAVRLGLLRDQELEQWFRQYDQHLKGRF